MEGREEYVCRVMIEGPVVIEQVPVSKFCGCQNSDNFSFWLLIRGEVHDSIYSSWPMPIRGGDDPPCKGEMGFFLVWKPPSTSFNTISSSFRSSRRL